MLKGSLPEVFLDTVVSFDIISKRGPHFAHAVKLLEFTARDKIALLILESSLTNLIYLSVDIYKLPDTVPRLLDFIGVCGIVSGGKVVMMEALASNFKDKEDALQYYTALQHVADYFLTRNIKDYRLSSPLLPVFSPLEFFSNM